ncbi:MAG TPA: hypothetical protein VFH76_07155 [Kribbella sp.]|nr:hypothetical protein [Kribbella sp.]
MEQHDVADAWQNRDSDAELPPQETAAQAAGRALANWIAEHPGDSGEGGVRILKDRTTVLVYWKGTVPAGLKSLAAAQSVPVTFEPAPYSRAELNKAMDAVTANNYGIVSAIGSEPDYSGISIALSSKAPPNAFDQVKATATTGIPITLRGIIDPKPLDRRTPLTGSTSAANGCPVPARCGDSAPFYGGSLIRIQGASGTACGTGASLYAGSYNYMSTAAHCGPGNGSGTWVGYDSGNVIGTINVAAGHLVPSKDFMIIGTASNFGRIWFGDWKTTTSIPVRRMERPFSGAGPVTCSCSASGSGHYQYVLRDNERWWIHDHWVQPGFYTEAYPDRNDPDNPSTGWVQPGDSGSPIVTGGSSYYYLEGFMSAVGNSASPYCAPGRHPGFNGDPLYGCFTEYWATYPDTAIGSLGGLYLKTS